MRCSVSIGRRFRSYLPEERIRDLWETEGLAFIQRRRIADGRWESPGPEPTGLYHVVVHAADCQLTATHNGHIRYTGYLPANTIQFSRADEEVRCTGHGSIRFLTVSFTPDFLASHLDSLFVNSDVVELREVRSARRVIDYIESNLTCDLQLVELSAVVGISRSHFARSFRNTIGMAPHTFVLQRRLARAVELLIPRKLSVREVAKRCGFADQAHLTRVFKSRFGHPPSLNSLHTPSIRA